MTIIMNYPSWQDDVRADRAAGMSINDVAEKYGISASRVSQLATPYWQAYAILWNERKTGGARSVTDAIKVFESGKYRLNSVKTLPPKQNGSRIVNVPKNYKEPKPEVLTVSKDRAFKQVKRMHEGKSLTGAEITCYKCSGTDTYFNFKGSVTPSHLGKEFIRKGWLVGNNERTDMCPSCYNKLRGKKPPRIEEEDFKPVPVVNMDILSSTSIIPALAKGQRDGERLGIPSLTPDLKEAPMLVAAKTPEAALAIAEASLAKQERVMTRADDQIIYLKLMDTYVDERVGYKEDWTDAKVAADLNVPPEWVATIRDRSFGPETNASMNKKSMEDLIAMGEAINRQILLADKKMEQMQQLDNKIVSLTNEGKALVARFEELLQSLKTEDTRVEGIITDFTKMVTEFKEKFSELKP